MGEGIRGAKCAIYTPDVNNGVPLQQGSQAEEVKGFEDRWRTEQSRSGFNQSNHLTAKNSPPIQKEILKKLIVKRKLFPRPFLN